MHASISRFTKTCFIAYERGNTKVSEAVKHYASTELLWAELPDGPMKFNEYTYETIPMFQDVLLEGTWKKVTGWRLFCFVRGCPDIHG